MERIIINNLSKRFRIDFKKNQNTLSRFASSFSGRETKKNFWVLKDVSFSVKSGEILGIIGKNGSGKSTLLRTIAGIYDKDQGTITTNGKLVPLINLVSGMQKRLSIEDNIYLCCSLFGFRKKAIKKIFNSIISFAELEEFANTKLYQFSNGMKQRLAFSIAINCNPDILLMDECLEIGDEKFKNKSLNKINELVKKGATILLVSHNLELIKKHCDRLIWMDKGRIIKIGNNKDIIRKYLEEIDFLNNLNNAKYFSDSVSTNLKK